MCSCSSDKKEDRGCGSERLCRLCRVARLLIGLVTDIPASCTYKTCISHIIWRCTPTPTKITSVGLLNVSAHLLETEKRGIGVGGGGGGGGSGHESLMVEGGGISVNESKVRFLGFWSRKSYLVMYWESRRDGCSFTTSAKRPFLVSCWAACFSVFPRLYFKSLILKPNCVQSFFSGTSPSVSPRMDMLTLKNRMQSAICNVCIFQNDLISINTAQRPDAACILFFFFFCQPVNMSLLLL